MSETSRAIALLKIRNFSISSAESKTICINEIPTTHQQSLFASSQINIDESFTNEHFSKSCFFEEENSSEESISIPSGVVTVDTSVGNTDYFVFKENFEKSEAQDSDHERCRNKFSFEMVEIGDCLRPDILSEEVDSVSVISCGSISIENFQGASSGQYLLIVFIFFGGHIET